MASKNLVLKDATWNGVESVDFQVSGGGTARYIETSDATAVASDIAQNKTAYVNGSLITGTATPTVPNIQALSVTQNGTYTASGDVDGYSPVTVSVSGGGGSGLEYETGTWEPSSDTISQFITFAGTHTVAPFYFEISDVTSSYLQTSSTNFFFQYTNYHQLSGTAINVDNAGVLEYGQVSGRFRLNSATALNNMVISITTPYTSSDDSTTACSRYWATETGINASSNGTRYWRPGRTYKWIAVWAPTS